MGVARAPARPGWRFIGADADETIAWTTHGGCGIVRLARQHLAEIHDVAIKAALKDQERAGIDIVSDGELRRDNDIDYLVARIPGVHIPHRAKADYYDYYDAEVTRPLPGETGIGLGLAADFAFTGEQADHPIKFSFTGPFSLSRRIWWPAGSGGRSSSCPPPSW